MSNIVSLNQSLLCPDLKALSTMSTEQDSRCVWLSKCVNIEPDSVIFKWCFSLPNPIPTQDLKLTQFHRTRPERKSAHFPPDSV